MSAGMPTMARNGGTVNKTRAPAWLDTGMGDSFHLVSAAAHPGTCPTWLEARQLDYYTPFPSIFIPFSHWSAACGT